VLEREDPRDAFISHKAERLSDLPEGALVGSASIRRRAQLAAMRPDIKFTLLRGNVGTRLGKLINGDCDATFLACAGLKRLGQEEVITEAIEAEIMLSAPAQRALDGSCRTPIAALAEIMAGGLNFRGEVIAKDGSIRFARSERFEMPSVKTAYDLGYRLGKDIRAEAGERILWDD